MPRVIGPGNLSEHRRRSLKEHSICKGHNASRGLKIDARARQFEHIKAHEAHIHNIARHSRDGDPIAYLDAIASDQEEIRSYREQNGLQPDSYARREKPRKRGQRTEFCNKAEDENKSYKKA